MTIVTFHKSCFIYFFNPLNAESKDIDLQVYQPGKVGRTIDLKKCESYTGLRRVLANLFNLQGQLDDVTKGWQLVYTDHENDVLLVGDDPWE